MILLIHAYSRNNRGDGLLVDASVEIIREAFPDDEIVVAALDPASFPELSTIPVIGGSSSTLRTAAAAAEMAARLFLRPLTGRLQIPGFSELACRARLIVGVGGGYMRTDGCVAGAKAILAQATQCIAAADSKVPMVYLPQSIGPFHPPFGWLMKTAIQKVPKVFVRDDRSLTALEDKTTLRRVPDLAIMELFHGEKSLDPKLSLERTYLVARDIRGSKLVRREYRERLQLLRELVPGLEPVVQSRGRGNDDIAFYRSIGWGQDFRHVTEVSAREAGVFVSVRLHGALQALILGNPAIHLSYERKGWGAYADLGISPYVHDVREFDPLMVAKQVEELRADSAMFWKAVFSSRVKAREARSEIVDALRKAAGVEPN